MIKLFRYTFFIAILLVLKSNVVYGINNIDTSNKYFVYDNEEHKIILRNIIDDNEFCVTDGDSYFPSIDKEGKYISYTFDDKIYLYDIKNNNSVLIDDGFVSKISKNGNYVVYESYLDEYIKIYRYDINKNETILISNIEGEAISPSISDDGEYISFQNIMNKSDIFLYDTINNSMINITKDNDDSSGNSYVSNNYVIYETYASNNTYNRKKKIMLYDIEKKSNKVITVKNNLLFNRDCEIVDVSFEKGIVLFYTKSKNTGYDYLLYEYKIDEEIIIPISNNIYSNKAFLYNDYIYFYYDGIYKIEIDKETLVFPINETKITNYLEESEDDSYCKIVVFCVIILLVIFSLRKVKE